MGFWQVTCNNHVITHLNIRISYLFSLYIVKGRENHQVNKLLIISWNYETNIVAFNSNSTEYL